MRVLYHECRLIHADLSEYNMLVHRDRLYVIDVSQSLEHDHPLALHFLRRDCFNVNNFYASKSVLTISLKDVFMFIIDPNITKKTQKEELEKLWDMRCVDSKEREEMELEDKIFQQIFIPRTLFQVDCENEKDLKQQKVKDNKSFTILGIL